jgi:hypothetical protein
MDAIKQPRVSHYGATHLVSFRYPCSKDGQAGLITSEAWRRCGLLIHFMLLSGGASCSSLGRTFANC